MTKPGDRAILALLDTAWKTLEDILPVLDPLAKATELLTKEDTPTLSQVHVILTQLLETIKNHPDDSHTAAGLKSRISAGLRNIFQRDERGIMLDSAVTSPAVRASFLDPRYKQLKFLSATQLTTLFQFVEDLMKMPHNSENSPNAVPHMKQEKMENEVCAKKPLFDCLLGDVDIDLTSSSTEFKEEIQMYLAEPVRVADPLSWWRINENRQVIFLFSRSVPCWLLWNLFLRPAHNPALIH